MEMNCKYHAKIGKGNRITLILPMLLCLAAVQLMLTFAELPNKNIHTNVFGRNRAFQPVLFFSSFFMRLRRFSIPRKSVIPYWKAIFSYSEGGAFLRISQTSTSGCDSVFPSPLHEDIRISECHYWEYFKTAIGLEAMYRFDETIF